MNAASIDRRWTLPLVVRWTALRLTSTTLGAGTSNARATVPLICAASSCGVMPSRAPASTPWITTMCSRPASTLSTTPGAVASAGWILPTASSMSCG